nr:hypothetical protein [Tanacetum cinerariifolium]
MDGSPSQPLATSPKKKATRNHQKRTIQSDDAPRQTAWTTEEEIVLAKDSFKLRHCWEILKDRPKWQEIAISNFNTGSEGGSKRHKSSGSSSFNTESREASINLNTTVGDDNDEDEVQEIRRPQGRDKARAAGRKKNKGLKSVESSNVNEDGLAKLMVNEITSIQKEERLAFLDIKRREVECRERELEQQDMMFYLQPYDHLTENQRKAMDEIRAKIKAKYNLQY